MRSVDVCERGALALRVGCYKHSQLFLTLGLHLAKLLQMDKLIKLHNSLNDNIHVDIKKNLVTCMDHSFC